MTVKYIFFFCETIQFRILGIASLKYRVFHVSMIQLENRTQFRLHTVASSACFHPWSNEKCTI